MSGLDMFLVLFCLYHVDDKLEKLLAEQKRTNAILERMAPPPQIAAREESSDEESSNAEEVSYDREE